MPVRGNVGILIDFRSFIHFYEKYPMKLNGSKHFEACRLDAFKTFIVNFFCFSIWLNFVCHYKLLRLSIRWNLLKAILCFWWFHYSKVKIWNPYSWNAQYFLRCYILLFIGHQEHCTFDRANLRLGIHAIFIRRHINTVSSCLAAQIEWDIALIRASFVQIRFLGIDFIDE